MINTISYFPNGIDPMIFFQDNDLDKVEVIDNYNKLISIGKYTDANKYIQSKENVYGYFADLFNAIENRIYSLQSYLLSKNPIKKQYVCFDANQGQEEPDIEEGMLWL